ncbi:hypothetical protein VB265_13170 [Enterobacter sichuanensis]|uniref:hypothetical protein n=1 Tax=Enterobacter sichuanensis TaxID=2071710 RepID=UPI002B1ED29A|nr:hypothetical protein [Enterobacter sichuanensis]MEA5170472.1 hypothetical protein [Enterobacter sichuanensis]
MINKYKWYKPLLLAALTLSSLTAQSAEKYGFSAGIRPCPLWSTFFPISFMVPGDNLTESYVKPIFNVIYISDSNLKTMDDFFDIYNINGSNIWPSNSWPYVGNGRDKAVCQNDGDCVTKGYGQVGRGISAYKKIKTEFPGETVKVMSSTAYGDGDITWFELATRKLKLLRVEYFTPYTGDGNLPLVLRNSDNEKYTEPLFFEYRATGNGDEMKLEETGGTAYGVNYDNLNLPVYIKLTRLSAIHVQLHKKSSNNNPWQRIYPSVGMVSFTDKLTALVPASCP